MKKLTLISTALVSLYWPNIRATTLPTKKNATCLQHDQTEKCVRERSNKNLIGEWLKNSHIKLPAKAAILVAKAFSDSSKVFYSYKNSGFDSSWGKYWPASSIKGVVAFAALLEMEHLKLRPEEIIFISKIRINKAGKKTKKLIYKGTFKNLIVKMIYRSSNRATSLLMRFIDVDRLNNHYLPLFKLNNTALRSGLTRANIHTANSIEVKRKQQRKVLKETKVSRARYITCSGRQVRRRTNCTTLYDMMKAQEHFFAERPPFTGMANKYPFVKKAFQDSYTVFRELVRSKNLFGRGTTLLGKPGNIRNRHYVENVRIDTSQGFYFLAIAYPHVGKCRRIKNVWKQLGCTTTKVKQVARVVLQNMKRVGQQKKKR